MTKVLKMTLIGIPIIGFGLLVSYGIAHLVSSDPPEATCRLSQSRVVSSGGQVAFTQTDYNCEQIKGKDIQEWIKERFQVLRETQ